MTQVTIFHNPRCSKSRETLALLESKGVEIQIVEYLKQVPDAATLSELLVKLDISARELMRTKEEEYKAQGLNNPELTEAQLIAAMIATPKLIERPIVLANGKAAIGRPPENVLAIL
ncbi:arsenate reductase (glutaredoxin) [Shewanella algae]|uniref:arsenate reductase (glutaredoxin) n=1 Tax=Shewanella algae TaxID=38313 RepID=UPI0011865592|nr:arsenate reductase (glutaredoxin) [Shewanella algae]MBO2600722.1 arsenate reductase (glutaredoxin) [Shewanella algae]MBO2624467.1 arsenate reductase (glutaredoxin) [Shewanella algae]MCE9778131.1 arsenate reductase (glutaredoxin) [Shewanella algae]MCE9826501.1 arsenate reductase (glutaredoxin) [Shewanella algae]TVP05445.1 arsenate reductase (glutaredoxin) [Shewanella algae]